MHPLRTKLDAALTALTATAGSHPTDPRAARLAAGALTALATGEVDDLGADPRLATIKLVVRSSEVHQATAWMSARNGRLDLLPTYAPGDTGLTMLVGRVDPGAIRELDAEPWAVRAEAPRLLLPRLDVARGAATGLDTVLAELPVALTGEGVLIAVVDTGVDWSHPDFRHPDGSSRIERFLHAHRDDGGLTSNYDFYSQTDVDAALAGLKQIPDGDPQGHGTHCASIAAGNGRGTPERRFRGVAPEAALMAVRSEPLYDDHMIIAISQAFELAGDRPAVVSLGLGSHLGAHDGTSALELEIGRQSGPGRIVVVAAGNEGEDAIHAQGQLVDGDDLVVPFRIADPRLQYVDVWIPRGDEVDVFVETPSGVYYEPTGALVETDEGAFRADFVEDPVNRDQNLLVLLAGGKPNDIWKVRVSALSVVHGEIHAWASTADAGTSRSMFQRPADGYSVGSPATAGRCLAVGSLVSGNRIHRPDGDVVVAPDLAVGGLSGFSSVGPTRNGGQKPDLVAPGHFVTAALAAGSAMASEPAYAGRRYPGAPYVTTQGTSTAASFVAGIVALMLQREPTLTPEEVRQRFGVTARRDTATGPVWNPRFGVGKLESRALFAYPA